MPKASAQKRGADTREKLLEAAVVLVGEVGWGAVTTRAVAARAGVNQALVHYHFGSVADLLTVATVRFAREVLAESVELLRAQGLERMFAGLGKYTGTDPGSLLLAEAFLAANRLPKLRAQLARLVAEFRAEVGTWLRELGNPDADAIAVLLGAAIDGLVLHRALDPALDFGVVVGPLRRLLERQG